MSVPLGRTHPRNESVPSAGTTKHSCRWIFKPKNRRADVTLLNRIFFDNVLTV